MPESVANPLKYYSNNTEASRSLIEAAVSGGVENFIFSSTAAVYGETEGVTKISEESQLNPASPYGTSKMMTEYMLRDIAKAHNLKYGILRYFNVAGADPLGRTGQSTVDATHLIKLACQAALGIRPELIVFGSDYPTRDGTCIRDYIHVTDLVESHLLLLNYLRNGGQSTILNCGYGQGYSVMEVIDALQVVLGERINVSFAKRRAGDTPELVANPDKIQKILNWKPKHDELHEIVRSALAWEKRLLTTTKKI